MSLARGVRGHAYVATIAAGGVILHLGNIVGYSMGGAVAPPIILTAVALGLAISLGNVIGRMIRAHLKPKHLHQIEQLMPLLCAVLATVGLGKMNSEVTNLLYRYPELYESVYRGDDFARARMCRSVFGDHWQRAPESILDVGCGTGRELAFLSRECADCVGIDVQRKMVEYARAVRPGLDFRVGDMRGFRLHRTFAAIISLGWAFNYMLTLDDIDRALTSLAVHSRAGTLLILNVVNSAAFLVGGSMGLTEAYDISSGEYSGTALASFSMDRRRQLLIRKREWKIPGKRQPPDYVVWRMLFPMELEHHLAIHGFKVLGMYDNTKLAESHLTGRSLYVTATYCGD